MTKVNFGALTDKDVKQTKTEKASTPTPASGYETRPVTTTFKHPEQVSYRLDKQISIKGPARVIERFQAVCAKDRWAYWQMLEMMTEAWEKH